MKVWWFQFIPRLPEETNSNPLHIPLTLIDQSRQRGCTPYEPMWHHHDFHQQIVWLDMITIYYHNCYCLRETPQKSSKSASLLSEERIHMNPTVPVCNILTYQHRPSIGVAFTWSCHILSFFILFPLDSFEWEACSCSLFMLGNGEQAIHVTPLHHVTPLKRKVWQRSVHLKLAGSSVYQFHA